MEQATAGEASSEIQVRALVVKNSPGDNVRPCGYHLTVGRERMIRLIEEHGEEIARLCREYHVLRLEVFGSAATDAFDPATSDLDFLVEFLPLPEGRRFDTYFGLLEDLQGLFGRDIDLVIAKAIKNQYFLKSINRNRKTLYAA